MELHNLLTPTGDGVSVHLRGDDDGSLVPDPLDIHIHVPKERKINIKLPEVATAAEDSKIPEKTQKTAEAVAVPKIAIPFSKVAAANPEVATIVKESKIPEATMKPVESQEVPIASPEVPTPSPKVPTPSPEVPTASPEVPTASPEVSSTPEDSKIPKTTKEPAEIAGIPVIPSWLTVKTDDMKELLGEIDSTLSEDSIDQIVKDMDKVRS